MAVVGDSEQSATMTYGPVHTVHTLCCQVCLTCLLCNQCCTWAINGYAIQKYCIHWLQAGYISGSSNVAYTTGQMARAAGRESNLYFTKICDFLELWREGKRAG